VTPGPLAYELEFLHTNSRYLSNNSIDIKTESAIQILFERFHVVFDECLIIMLDYMLAKQYAKKLHTYLG